MRDIPADQTGEQPGTLGALWVGILRKLEHLRIELFSKYHAKRLAAINGLQHYSLPRLPLGVVVAVVIVIAFGYAIYDLILLRDVIAGNATQSDYKQISSVARTVLPLSLLHLSILCGRRKQKATSFVFLVIAIAVCLYYVSAYDFVTSLGVDSLAEAKSFNLNEALFWASTMTSTLKPRIHIREIISLVVFAFFYLFLLKFVVARYLRSRRFMAKVIFPASLLVVATVNALAGVIVLFNENSKAFESVMQNFNNPSPNNYAPCKRNTLFVYIGESSSAFNFQIYGYKRETNPNLTRIIEEDPGLVVFNNVFSTHTHTSQSLLEALSFSFDNSDLFLPITRRKRISVVDVLEKSNARVTLISNQGMTGTWNQVSPTVFKSAKRIFSVDTRFLGNREPQKRPFDDEFFEKELSKINFNNRQEAQVVFLHSYAGHGSYLKNIPPSFRSPVDSTFVSTPLENIATDKSIDAKLIDSYDSAIRYVDYSVSKSLHLTQELDSPGVFIYFSDHGDSAYTNRGHDSTRFVHEMARVPFIIYFNKAFRDQRPELFKKYKSLAESRNISTLAQLPATILDILGTQSAAYGSLDLRITPVMGAASEHPPIVVREKVTGIEYINLNNQPMLEPSGSGEHFQDVTDIQTKNFVRSRSDAELKERLCRETPTTFEEQRRHEMILGCGAG